MRENINNSNPGKDVYMFAFYITMLQQQNIARPEGPTTATQGQARRQPSIWVTVQCKPTVTHRTLPDPSLFQKTSSCIKPSSYVSNDALLHYKVTSMSSNRRKQTSLCQLAKTNVIVHRWYSWLVHAYLQRGGRGQ